MSGAGLVCRWWSGGCWFDRDGVAEGLEFGDQALGFSFGIVRAIIEISAEVGVGTVAGEDVPDDHYEGVRGGGHAVQASCRVPCRQGVAHCRT